MSKENNIIKISSKIAEQINAKRESLIKAMLNYESYETVCYELKKSLDTLQNLGTELDYLSIGRVESISTFFPLNLPLYSFILFGVVPGFLCNRIFIRPPILMRNVLENILRILEINDYLPKIKLLDVERHIFYSGYVSTSDVVLFTGKYENAVHVRERCPSALFIYNGAGVNPIIVNKYADLDIAIQKTIEMRVFNSGQDCAGPDAILIDEKILCVFLEKLLTALDAVKVGDYFDREVRVGKLIDKEQPAFVGNLLNEMKDKIVYGGTVNYRDSIVYPTVILDGIGTGRFQYKEFFAPIFYLLQYKDNRDLDLYFLDERYLKKAMYVSIFGKTGYKNIKKSTIIMNKIVNDVEDGNKAYGGYGMEANFVSLGDKYLHKPILISKEIHNYINEIRK